NGGVLQVGMDVVGQAVLELALPEVVDRRGERSAGALERVASWVGLRRCGQCGAGQRHHQGERGWDGGTSPDQRLEHSRLLPYGGLESLRTAPSDTLRTAQANGRGESVGLACYRGVTAAFTIARPLFPVCSARAGRGVSERRRWSEPARPH